MIIHFHKIQLKYLRRSVDYVPIARITDSQSSLMPCAAAAAHGSADQSRLKVEFLVKCFCRCRRYSRPITSFATQHCKRTQVSWIASASSKACGDGGHRAAAIIYPCAAHVTLGNEKLDEID